MNADFFLNYADKFSYLGAFLAVALTGYLLPVPEEIMLIVIGYLASIGFGNVYFIIISCIAGLLLGDSVIFWLAGRGAGLIKKLMRHISPSRLKRYEERARNHMARYIFGLRFVPSLRFLSPVIAGSLKLRWGKFILYDALAAIIYAPILVLLGYHFQNRLADLAGQFEILRHTFFILAIIGLGLWMTHAIHRRFYINEKES